MARAALAPLLLALAASTVACGSLTAATASGSDAGTASGDASAAVGCARHPNAIFCADFDSVTDPQDSWSLLANDGSPAATLKLDANANAPSPPNAALIDLQSAPKGSRFELRKSGLANAKKIRFGFAIRADATIGEIAYLSFGAACSFNLSPVGSPGGVWLETDGTGDGSPVNLNTGIRPQHWGRFALELDWDAQTFDVTVDGTSALDHPAKMQAGCVFGGKVEVDIGPHYFASAQTSPMQVDFDDVFLEPMP